MEIGWNESRALHLGFLVFDTGVQIIIDFIGKETKIRVAISKGKDSH